jgi:hypothetical protein
MICSTCGREIADGSRFCTYCGAHIEPAIAQEPEAPVEPTTTPDILDTSEAESAADVQPEWNFAPSPADPYAQQPQATPDVQPAQDFVSPQDSYAQPPAADPYAPPTATPYTQPLAADPYAQPTTTTPYTPPPATPYAQPAADPYAQPPAGDPYAQPPVGNAVSSAPYAQSAGQGYAPPAGTLQSGSAYPPAFGQPGQPGQPGPPKKSRTGLVVGIIIAVVLVVCVALSVGGFLLFQRLAAQSTSVTDFTSSDFTGDTNSSNNNNNGSNTSGNNTTPSSSEDVLIDSEILVFSVDVDSGVLDNILDWYQVSCTIENKTNKTLGIYFDYDTKADNGIDDGNIIIIPDGEYLDFPPNKICTGIIVFLPLEDESAITSVKNLTGTLIIYDAGSGNYETLAEYPVSIPAL